MIIALIIYNQHDIFLRGAHRFLIEQRKVVLENKNFLLEKHFKVHQVFVYFGKFIL